MWVRASNSNNCFVCLLESKYDLFRLVFPLRGSCLHIHKHTRIPYYRICWRALILDFFVSIFMLPAWISYFVYPPATCSVDKTLCLIFLGDQILTTISLIIGVLELFYMKLQTTEFNAWTVLFENRRRFVRVSLELRPKAHCWVVLFVPWSRVSHLGAKNDADRKHTAFVSN